MSLSLSDAKTYIAKVVGGQSRADVLSDAGDALAAAMEWFCLRHNWKFLEVDTSQSFTVTADTTWFPA